MSAAHLFNAIFNAGLTVFLLTLVTSLGMTFSVKQILSRSGGSGCWPAPLC